MPENGITEVGKYRIVEQVGEGAMGVVYRGFDPVLNRTVAIKVMTDAVARDDELRGRFLREAQAAGSLQHPNVITIYDFGEVDGHLFIAMEFVAGADLEEILHRGIELTVGQRLEILVDVLAGLGYAHKRGVVHRDIKPANIRIDDEGRARIMDFGIAHLQSSKMTRTGLMVGTPAYMAPEQVTGGSISPATDLFSVGAVMYELFTGRRPFEGESLQSVFYKIVSQPPADLTTFSPSLPGTLNSIVMRALEKNPADRFPTAADMANALSDARSRLDEKKAMPKRISLQSAIDSGLSMRPTEPMRVHRDRPSYTKTVVGSAVGILALAAVGFFALKGRPDTPAASTSTAPPATGPSTTPTTAPAPAAPPVNPPAPVQPAGVAAPAKTADRSASKAAKTDAPSAQEIALFRSLQATALDARRRASDAGATAEQLRAGDDHNATASAAAQNGKLTDAASHVTLASTAWTNAEREARAAAAAATAAASASAAKTRVAEPPKPDPVVAAPPVSAPVAAPAPPVRAAANPAADIGGVVNAYEKAIESRDLSEVRRAYVGITPAQASAWEQFFRSIRSIRVTFSVGNLDIRGDAAEARLTGAYEFVTSAGKNERQPANFQATFRHDAGVWKLTAVR